MLKQNLNKSGIEKGHWLLFMSVYEGEDHYVLLNAQFHDFLKCNSYMQYLVL